MSDVINVYKSNHTSPPVWNITISFFYQQARKSVRRHNVVKYCWSVHALLNRITTCETSNSKWKYHCVPWYIQIWQLLSNYHIEANRLNFSQCSRFELRIPGVHFFVPPNVDLVKVMVRLTQVDIQTNAEMHQYESPEGTWGFSKKP